MFTTVSVFIFSNSSHTYKQPVQNGRASSPFFFFPRFLFFTTYNLHHDNNNQQYHTPHFAIFKLNIFCAIQNKCTHTLIFCFFLVLQKNKKIAVIYKSHNNKKVNILHTSLLLRWTQQKRVLLLLTCCFIFIYFFKSTSHLM